MFSDGSLPRRVFLKDMQSMKECSGAGSPAVSVPWRLPSTAPSPELSDCVATVLRRAIERKGEAREAISG